MPRRRSDDAVALRYRSTDVERKLWYDLRGRRFLGWKFRRQHAIGPFIADFACVEATSRHRARRRAARRLRA